MPANPELVGSEPLRILVADDDPQMRRLIKRVLQREGFEVVEAVDGLDAPRPWSGAGSISSFSTSRCPV